MNTSTKYFNYGIPPHPLLPVYGLYQPSFDRFLVVHTSLSLLNKIKSLLTSRYNTFTVCLNTADNYFYKIIDNSVCENWTFENKDMLNINSPSNIFIDDENICATNLIDNTVLSDETILKEKQWVLMCMHWVYAITLSRTIYNNCTYYGKLDTDLRNIIDHDLNYVPEESIVPNKILKLLYFGVDFEKTNYQIIELANTHEILSLYA